MANTQLEKELNDAVDAIVSEEATIEEKMDAALTMLAANPSESGVRAAVAKLQELRGKQGAFESRLPGGTGGGAPPTSTSGSSGSTAGAAGATDASATGGQQSAGNAPPATGDATAGSTGTQGGAGEQSGSQ